MRANNKQADIIYLHDLKIETVIGIFNWERQVKQTVRFDIDMATDIHKASLTDDIKDTLDYKAVAKRLIDYVGNSNYKLVETLAEKSAEMIMKEFDISWLRLRINKKGAIRGANDVGVIIERGTRG